MEKLTCPDPVRPAMGAGPAAGEPAAKKSDGGADEGAAAGSGGFGRTCGGRWLPEEHRKELYKVVRLTGPLVSGGRVTFDVTCCDLLLQGCYQMFCTMVHVHTHTHVFWVYVFGKFHHFSEQLCNQK